MNILDTALYQSDLKKVVQGIDFSEFKNKSILITGGLGLICSTITDLLLIANFEKELNIKIYLAARNKTKFDDRYQGYSNIEFVKYDALKSIDFRFDVDYIICGAGLASPEKYVSEPVETMLSNLTGIKNLLEYAQTAKTKRVLYISSSEIYGNKQTEDNFVEGCYGAINLNSIRSSYSIAKQASELLCKSFTSEYGVDTVIARPGHIFGPTASEADKKISSDFAYKAAKSLPLELKSSGLQKRSYCYSIDAAAAILFVLLNGNSGEAYNICTEENLTIREMAEVYARAGQCELLSVKPTEEELKAFNPMNNSSLSFDKLGALGYRPFFSVVEGLEHTVQILREYIKP